MRAPELLLPAGSPDKLDYAIAYGADAVYLGLPMASLRTPSRGSQFSVDNLGKHVQRAQAQAVKVYVTTNIFASNRDLDRLIPHFEQLESIRPDAIILSDPGVFRLARRYAPSVPVHLSTQANTLNAEACAFWQDMGVSRVILAREVPVYDMAAIHEQVPDLELECFVHGSICVAYSGRCMISDYLTDNTKNSNKGMCGNSCRWEFQPTPHGEPETPVEAEQEPEEASLNTLTMVESTRPHQPYTFEEDDKGTYMLNSKDMCLISALRELYEAGIISFKVEGRTKSIYYAAVTGYVYRQAINWWQSHHWQADPPAALVAHWVQELRTAGNRGFTEGFLHGRPDDTAYNYLDCGSDQTARFIATANWDSTRQAFCIRARNPFAVDEAVDWLTPSGAYPQANLHGLLDQHGLPVRQLQTNQVAWYAGRPPTLPPNAAISQPYLLRSAHPSLRSQPILWVP